MKTFRVEIPGKDLIEFSATAKGAVGYVLLRLAEIGAPVFFEMLGDDATVHLPMAQLFSSYDRETDMSVWIMEVEEA